jgi:hypothetical protein
MLLTALKAIDAPGSVPFLVIAVALGVVTLYVWPRNRRVGRAWLMGVAAAYLVLSLPWVAQGLSAQRVMASLAHDAVPALDTLFVLDGDNREGRVRKAVAVFRATNPREVWVVGNLWLLDPLLQAGIPWERLRHDEMAETTRDQVRRIHERVLRAGVGRAGIVASRLQMPRVVALARKEGLQVLLMASPADTEPATSGLGLFVPSYAALGISRDAIYERAALAYYRWRRWAA